MKIDPKAWKYKNIKNNTCEDTSLYTNIVLMMV